MANVIVEMKTCSKRHRINITSREDGDFDVHIESDCPKISAYGERLNRISMMDIVSFEGSRIIAPDMRLDISSNCLAPLGVFNAGWLEAGLMTKTLAKKAGSNEIVFDEED